MHSLTEMFQALRDAAELLEVAAEENDEESIAAIEEDVSRLEADIERLEFQRMFSGEMDERPCFLDIQAGSGISLSGEIARKQK